MATIALYASKINNMPSLIKDVKSSVKDLKSELTSFKNKCQSVNRNICNLDDVISSISTSTQTQEQKVTSLDNFSKDVEQFASDVAQIDGNVADMVNKNKDDFYDKYHYLKPDCEKGLLEQAWDGCKSALKSAGEWCKEHWVEILIGIAFIVVGALLTFLTSGAFLPALLAGLKAAAIAGLISGGISAGISIIGSIINGEDFGTLLGKALNALGDGFASGFMMGGIFAGSSQIISGVMKISAQMGATGRSFGSLKLWSPNSLTNPNSGGTLFKIGKTFRLDFEAGKQLFHTHITKNLFNKLPTIMKNMNWLFDPAKRDVHVRLTELLGGIIGATKKKD